MTSPLISMIIAVYNNEKYLENAVRSVTEQVFDDFELVIIDDGSTDKSGIIADDLSRNDDHIRVIHQENRWIYASFNRGVREARGEYIYILNSDDMLLAGSLMKLSGILEKYDFPDVIWTQINTCQCDDDQRIISQKTHGAEDVEERYYSDPEEFHRSWQYIYENDFSVNQANLYRRELMLAHPFRNDVYGADTLFNISIAGEIRTCVVFPEPVYRFNMFEDQRNTSVGKYYPYENAMFSEFYRGHRDLLQKWGLWDDKSSRFFAERRLQQLIHVLGTLELPSCNLTSNEKIRMMLCGFCDDTVKESAGILGMEEEFDCRILGKIREYTKNNFEAEDSGINFVMELLECLMKFEKNEGDIEKIRRAVYNEKNPLNLGKALYETLLKE